MNPQSSSLLYAYPMAILTGPTACGKTSLSLQLARQIPKLHILNADSLLFYQRLNIGTAKPSPEELREIPHLLIDTLKPNETMTAADYVRQAHALIHQLHQEQKRVLIVGGSGFYLKALIFGVWDAPPTLPEFRKSLEQESNEALFERLKAKDPEHQFKIHLNDRYRLVRALEILESGLRSNLSQHPTESLGDFRLYTLDRTTEDMEERIRCRTQQMLNQGLLEETQALYQEYGSLPALESVGYYQCLQYLKGIKPEGRTIAEGIPGLRSEIELATRQLVKAQRTFMKSQFKNLKHLSKILLPEQEASLLKELQALYSHSPSSRSNP